MDPETTMYHKRLAELISRKQGEALCRCYQPICTKIRVSLLKSILLATRGERGGRRKENEVPKADLSLNIVPDQAAYEVKILGS